MGNVKPNTIDLTPSWPEALNVYLLMLKAGSKDGKKTAIEGLKQMAKVAQMYVDLTNKVKETNGPWNLVVKNGRAEFVQVPKK